MLQSKLQKQGQAVSRLGFGCMRFPTGGDGKIHQERYLELIDRAYRQGITYFDTAYGYHNGESELAMKKALSRYPRESFQLADKLPVWLLQEEGDADRLFEEQLEKCGVEYFDVYLFHALNRERWETCQRLGVYEKLLERKRRGQIKLLGFSFHGPTEEFMGIIDDREWDIVQIQINYVDDVYQDAGRLYRKLEEKNIPCVVMEPVRGGFLAKLPDSAGEILSRLGDTYSPAGWAMRWCMNLPNAAVILSGMGEPEQVDDNVRTFSEFTPLTGEQLEVFDRTREAILAIKTVPCTGCGYCMECPFGVNIPGVFAIYNEYQLFQNPYAGDMAYGMLGKEHQGAACTGCGACSPMCPQGIDIPARLAEAHGVLSGIQM